MGRPSKYKTHVLPRFDEIEDWCRNGATDKEVAERLGIAMSSFSEYKKEFSEFSEVLKKTKEYVDGQVENALLKNALGGNITAQIFWLKNRRPNKWRDKVEPKVEENINSKEIIVDNIEKEGEDYVKQDTDI